MDSFCLTDAIKTDDVVMPWHVNQWTKLILKVLERFRLLSLVLKLERLDSNLPCGAIVECLLCKVDLASLAFSEDPDKPQGLIDLTD